MTDEPAARPAASKERALLSGESQWQLIRRRFKRHKLAVAAMYLLVVLATLAVFSEFIAPYTREWRNLDHAYSPPQPPRFSFSEGLYVHPVKLHVDPVTFQKNYVVDYDRTVPLGFFVKGESYRLWGLIPMDRHLFGVDVEAYRSQTQAAQRPAEADTPDEANEAGDGEPADGAGPTSGARAAAGPSPLYLLGADKYGRDIFSRIVYGARVSLSVGLVGIAVTFVLGVAIGGISGYAGGATDNFIQRSIEVINAFPRLPLWLAFAAVLPRDWSPLQVYFGITVALSLLNWTGLARVVRGKILSLREEDYATAARLLGAGHGRILFRHLLPGFTSHIIVTLTLSIPAVILGETSLSFLGLGLRPPVVSWGVLLQDCLNMDVVANYPWLLLPVVFIILTVLSCNFLGDGLRDAADPYAVN